MTYIIISFLREGGVGIVFVLEFILALIPSFRDQGFFISEKQENKLKKLN